MNVKTKDLIDISIFTALIAIGAFIKIPVPVCPFTLQLLFTTLAGIILGAKKGAISVLCYIIIGLIGVPIFVSGGGLLYIFQPTFGYLSGFALGSFVTGCIANSSNLPSFKRLILANFIGLAIVYTLGMLYYWFIMTFYVGSGIGIFTLFLYCFILAVPGDIALCILAAVLGKRLLPVLKRNNIGFNA
ncbi:MAG: biotin transporter BioY [Clostridium sp.]|uniref:biotin transporter BioY n=1 Tax=Clostridium sp. DSM 8431 TaxID=1761781 RepID=UPI0008E669C4|nr:biotin transporter BioY [Clostridium sp. DSM 8431]MCR4944186.1 biotin transporter BioY [Clostridium sp.]SFU31912.1 biotin transport system substrate-specific component [Clostridium sp. DSM 8431]